MQTKHKSIDFKRTRFILRITAKRTERKQSNNACLFWKYAWKLCGQQVNRVCVCCTYINHCAGCFNIARKQHIVSVPSGRINCWCDGYRTSLHALVTTAWQTRHWRQRYVYVYRCQSSTNVLTHCRLYWVTHAAVTSPAMDRACRWWTAWAVAVFVRDLSVSPANRRRRTAQRVWIVLSINARRQRRRRRRRRALEEMHLI